MVLTVERDELLSRRFYLTVFYICAIIMTVIAFYSIYGGDGKMNRGFEQDIPQNKNNNDVNTDDYDGDALHVEMNVYDDEKRNPRMEGM